LTVWLNDVVAAFISSSVGDQDIYITIPKGFPTPEDGKQYVYKLRKAVEGLKASAACFSREFDSVTTDLGFTNALPDSCIYVRHDIEQKPVVIVRFVDDFAIASAGDHGENVRLNLMTRLKERGFDTSRSERLDHIGQFVGLRIRFCRDTWTFYLSHPTYLDEAASVFGVVDFDPQRGPLPTDTDFHAESPPSDVKEYQSIIGKLMHHSCVLGIEVHYAVCRLAQHMHKPTKHLFKCAQTVLAYSYQHKNRELPIGGSQSMELVGYSDSDYGGSRDGTSTSGYVFTLGQSCISWGSKKQKLVVLSSTEAEYHALLESVKEAIVLKNVLRAFDPATDNKEPTKIFVDNKSAIDLASRGMPSSRNRHMDIRLFWFKQELENKSFILHHISTHSNCADLLTKLLPPVKIALFSGQLRRMQRAAMKDGKAKAKLGRRLRNAVSVIHSVISSDHPQFKIVEQFLNELD
jgi:hypothetical protein